MMAFYNSGSKPHTMYDSFIFKDPRLQVEEKLKATEIAKRTGLPFNFICPRLFDLFLLPETEKQMAKLAPGRS